MSKHASFPKPRPAIEDRIAYKRAEEAKARAFRDAVWLRDGHCCTHCGRRVYRVIFREPYQGHVHHLRGRNVAPQDRYNPKRAVLLCAEHHALAQRHEITISAPR